MTIEIRLLGQFDVRTEGEAVDIRSRPAQSLFAYLALNAGLTQRREKLAGLFWPDSTGKNARTYLRQALWRIRRGLEEADLDWEAYLTIDDLSVRFDLHADYWLDGYRGFAGSEK